MIKRLKLADGRVVRTIRLGLEILLFTALAHAYFYIASERRNRAACCGPGCRTALEGAALHYDRKYFSWQVSFSAQFRP